MDKTKKESVFNSDCTVNGQSQISLTLWTKKTGIITKKISKDANGQSVKDGSQCLISEGEGQVIKMNFQDFPDFLKKLNMNQAISHGVPKNKKLPSKFQVLSGKKFKKKKNQNGTITRSLGHIGYPDDTNTIVMIDYDPPAGIEGISVDALVSEIDTVLPGFKDAAKVITNSTSSCISDENGQEVTGPSSGYHIYFMLPPGADVPRFQKIFKVRAWLKGHGYILVSESGAMLPRNHLFDEFVMSPERLDFVAGAKIPNGWMQTRPEPVYYSGCVFDPMTLPDLKDTEKVEHDDMVEAAKSAQKGDAETVREKYITTRAKEMHEMTPGIPLEQCEATIKQACSDRDLYGDFIIHPDNMDPCNVSEIISNPDLYDKVSCADPLEPLNTAGKAKIYLNQGKGNNKPIIKSFLHGDHIFFLHPESAFDAEQVVANILQWIRDTGDTRMVLDGWLSRIKGLKSNDIDTIKNAVSTKTDTKISILNKVLKDQKAKDKKALKKINQKNTSTKRIQNGIREILYSPTATGECCQKVSQALRDHPEEKIYRFAGKLIKIINKQPSTVRMVKKAQDQGGKYPSMPVINMLSQETLCHEIEKVAVCQSKDAKGNIKDIAWPKNILTGVMALTEFHEKPLVGIVEHPFINDDFKPVVTQGYDDDSGFYKVFDVIPDMDFFPRLQSRFKLSKK